MNTALPEMPMNPGGNLNLTEDRAQTVKEILCFVSTCLDSDVCLGIGPFFFNICVSVFWETIKKSPA